jgi:hypothetical protein
LTPSSSENQLCVRTDTSFMASPPYGGGGVALAARAAGVEDLPRRVSVAVLFWGLIDWRGRRLCRRRFLNSGGRLAFERCGVEVRCSRRQLFAVGGVGLHFGAAFISPHDDSFR